MTSTFRTALAAVAFLAGVVLACCSGLSGLLGLGVQDNFLFYRLWGIPRLDALSIGAAICLFSGLALARQPGFYGLKDGFCRVEAALAKPWRLPILLFLAVAVNLALIFGGFGSGFMFAIDSQSYLGNSVIRSIGYPLFLDLVRGLTGSFNALAPIQLLLMDSGFLLLALELTALTKSRFLGLAVGLLLIFERWQQIFGMTLMTEALFVFLVCLHFALAIRFIRRQEIAALLGGVAVLAAACVVRPAGYSLFLGIPLLALLSGQRKGRIFLIGTVVAALIMAGASLAQYVRTGQFSPQSFAGIVLVGQVAPLITADTPSADPALTAEVAAALEPFQRSFEGLSYPRDYWRVTASSYNAMLWPVIMPILASHVREKYPALMSAEQTVAENQTAMSLSLAVLRHRPFAFARHVLAQDYGMWVGVFDLPEPLGVVWPRNHQCLLETLRVSPNSEDLGLQAHPRPEGRWADLAAGIIDTISGLDSIARMTVLALAFAAPALCLSRRGRNQVTQATLYLCLQLNGYFLLVASTQASIPRYPAAFDAVSVALAALVLAQLLLQRPTVR